MIFFVYFLVTIKVVHFSPNLPDSKHKCFFHHCILAYIKIEDKKS